MAALHGFLRISTSRSDLRERGVRIQPPVSDQPRSEHVAGATAAARAVDDDSQFSIRGVGEERQNLVLQDISVAQVKVLDGGMEHIRVAERRPEFREEVDSVIGELL